MSTEHNDSQTQNAHYQQINTRILSVHSLICGRKQHCWQILATNFPVKKCEKHNIDAQLQNYRNRI